MVKCDVEKEVFSMARSKREGQQKLEEEGIQKVSFKELIKLNFPDWHFVLVGIFFSAVIGALFPLMAILFSEVLRVGQ